MKPQRQITPKEALIKVETLCAHAEHSTGEIADKLRRWGISTPDIEKIIHSLVKNRFVDDERFARAYVNDKIKFAGWGKRKVYQGLKLKKIDSDTIKGTLAEIDDSLYTTILEKIIRAKIASKPELMESYEGRTRLFRFAVSRGFETQLCIRIFQKIIENKDAQS